jgi:alkanesulfonate monooxygenase SsuD/methylene tetrahydromethanopterin reductase-like flavin-dependent oxidoreductase (luciferase family)
MKFYVSTAFLDTREGIEIAKAADDLGYHGIAVPDHVINLETLQTPYPYTKDGNRRWETFTDWPDPWVIIGAIALVTTRLHFVTTVYLPPMRDPYSAAKSIGTAAVLAAADWSWASAWAGAARSSNCWASGSSGGASAPTRCWS